MINISISLRVQCAFRESLPTHASYWLWYLIDSVAACSVDRQTEFSWNPVASCVVRTLALRSIRKGSSLCPNQGTEQLCWSVPLHRHHARTEALSSCKDSAQRIMGAQSVHQLYPSKSFITKGPLKWLVLSTTVWNDPSIWQPWLFALRMALRRAIDPVS